MDTLQYNTIISKLEKLNYMVNDFGENNINVYGPLIVGFFAIIASIYIGIKQVKATTVNSIRIDTINQLRKLMFDFYNNIEIGNDLVSNGESGYKLNHIFQLLANNILQFKILLDLRNGVHLSFIKELQTMTNLYKTLTQNRMPLSNEYMTIQEKVFNKLDAIITQELKKL